MIPPGGSHRTSDREDAMGLIFQDPLHDEFAAWALGFAP